MILQHLPWKPALKSFTVRSVIPRSPAHQKRSMSLSERGVLKDSGKKVLHPQKLAGELMKKSCPIKLISPPSGLKMRSFSPGWVSTHGYDPGFPTTRLSAWLSGTVKHLAYQTAGRSGRMERQFTGQQFIMPICPVMQRWLHCMSCGAGIMNCNKNYGY